MNAADTSLHAELEARLRFETLIADLSSKFVNLPASEVDREIMDAERQICEVLDLDISAIWQWSAGPPGCFALTHYYSAQDGPQPSMQLSDSDFPWFRQLMIEGRIVPVSSLEEMPAEAALDRENCRRLGVKSNLCFPLRVGGEPLGILGLNTTRTERAWPDALVKRMQLLAQIFANALARKRADEALRESEERMTLAAEAAELGVWVWSLARDSVWGSERWLRLFGFASGEAVSFERTIQRIHPDDRETVDREVRHALACQSEYAGEFRAVLPDGTQRWIASRGRGYPDANGATARMLGAAIDITERKQTEAALRVNEARLAAGTELAGLGYYEVDYAERTGFLDDRFRETCGIPSNLREGLEPVQFWLEHVHPADRQYLSDQRQELHSGKVDRIAAEYRYLHPAKGQRWLHHSACVAERRAGGAGISTFGVVRDITETKRLSERVQAAAEEWQATFDSINDLVMILDTQYRITRVNAATVRFLGLPMERIVGSLCCTLIHGTSCPIEGCPCQKTFQTCRSSQLELLHPGSGKWLLLSTDPIQDAAGNITGAVHVGRDITDAKQAEAELMQRRTELAHITRVSTMSQLASSLAHELNQPLGAILRNAEAAELFLQDPSPDLEEVRAILADIRSDDQRAGEVIDRVRALMKRREVNRGPVDPGRLAGEVFTMLRPDADMRRVQLVLQIDPPVPSVHGDRVQLQQVLLNLLLNAMEAVTGNPPASRLVTLRARPMAATVELSVSDNGHGIAADRLPRLFEPFFTSKPNGLGMGLAISRGIVEAHGGRMWANNEPAGGARFSFTLPVSGEGPVAEGGR